jgi:hypothetical protein
MCVNVYTFDPAEEMVSCCACLLTPNSLKALSVDNDLLSNPLTLGIPDSVVIKLLATIPNGNTCNPAGPFQANPVRPANPGDFEEGLRGWVSSLHQNTQSSAYQTTERMFQDVRLSFSELNKLMSNCNFIQANGSGFGICKSCREGGLGSTRK